MNNSGTVHEQTQSKIMKRNERNPTRPSDKGLAAMSQAGPQTKTGQGTSQTEPVFLFNFALFGLLWGFCFPLFHTFSVIPIHTL
jgi:hypothetical protein